VLPAGVLRVSDATAERVWRELEGRLRPFVARRVAAPADADDVLQDVFLRVQRSIAQVREEDRLGPWLFQVARSAIAEHGRARMRHPLARDADVVEAPAPEPSGADDDELTSELVACVAHFVTLLPSPYREAITLTELEGVSQKDAAAMLGISHSGVKSRVQRGREQLRRMFEDACAIELDARRKVTECEPRSCGGCGPARDPDAS
jgi:RNA polymerase sigma-70 factor (ECF subfamily)